MINLRVQDYCHNCPCFEPEIYMTFDNDKCHHRTIVCANRDMCKAIKTYLDSVRKDENSNG